MDSLRMRILKPGFVLLLTMLAFAESSAQELTKVEKKQFLDTICEGMSNSKRCLTGGGLVLGLSLNWVIFEGCSASGQRADMVQCFDRAVHLAAKQFDRKHYLETYRYCHRFSGDHVEDAVVRCYREGFKYTDHNAEKK